MNEINNEINDDFYAESVEKTKSILDEAIAKLCLVQIMRYSKQW